LKTHPALADLLFPKQSRRKVLALLLIQPHQKMHLRELAHQMQAAPGTLKKSWTHCAMSACSPVSA